ncbi:anthranilate synthase component 1 [Clostridium cavendishii DSM 21758]|uniref:Anthranilate synthase component 1 n=1 Tax=Clostridium cavendishii DSM 21758 TaxID=1121302 RepID=A0A1M6I5H0_9CLOT|nr:chorismate-binding protein [Clostridium cavendishii]SHJ29691.1 anthranilate synthase component 1 [Clostridium cavendishii DSM 21758]
MVNLSCEEFKKLKNEEKSFSLVSSFRGDEITPIKLYSNLNGREKFLLEGGSKEGRFGRYSFFGEKVEKYIGKIEKVSEILNKEFVKSTNPFPFKGGAVGFVAYDILPKFHSKLSFNNKEDFELEDIRFFIVKDYICYDSFTHKVHFVTTILNGEKRGYEDIIKMHKNQYEYLSNSSKRQVEDFSETDVSYSPSKEEYLEKVKKAKKYIREGDVFQVVISRRAYIKTKKNPLQIYRNLRQENPSPYMFLLEFKEYSILGSSPESLVRTEAGRVITNPIAGSRKRGKTEEEDLELENQLLKDEKERAEHIMLVDLGRNDIGKVSKVGTVNVSESMKVERFSHIMHICSTVQGELQEGLNSLDALVSIFPAGTLSGAPKLRAMEIIEELEEVKRGFYAGAVGYFSYGGNMDMCICIRSLLLKDGIAYLQAGAGIVQDSIPEEEFKETENKLKALMEVIK